MVLVGPPGAGKTTVAKAVSGKLGLPMRDTDEDIVSAEGTSIAEIFIDKGEGYFRGLERAAVNSALEAHEGVLALGGGAILSEKTRALLKDECVVFLDVGLAAAVKRVGMNANRPLLLGNVRAQLKSLMDQRRTRYLEVASLTIDTDNLDPDEIADQVLAFLEKSS
ncbi:MAG: shikimate kinase [Aeromicrobium sp.]